MWKKVNVLFKLKSPLHIGYTPFKGSVISPTRYYVPGRNLWGAITKRTTEYLCEENHRKPEADDYKGIGKQVMENFRFSYFYLYDGRAIYFPRYTDEGLKYGDNREEINKSEFEHKFIGSLISTTIDNNGTAKDESLHEIEFINNRFKDANGNLKDVKIAGYIWIKENAKIEDKEVIINDMGIFIGNFNVIREVILGGESKYGFGHVLLNSINRVRFPIEMEYEQKKSKKSNDNYGECIINIRIDENKPLISHLRYDKDIKFKGDIELLAGRGYFDLQNPVNASDKPGKVILKPEYYLSPGTVLNVGQNVELCYDGRMIICSE